MSMPHRPPVSSSARIAFPALLAGATCIAFAPIFVRLSELGPVATAFYRVALSLPVLWCWVWLAPAGSVRRPRVPRDFFHLALAGVFFACDLAVWHWSIRLTAVANATLLANFAPIFVTLGSWWFFGERFTARFLVSIAVGITGAVILLGDSLSLSTGHLVGDALGALTAVFYGGYILTVSRLRRAFPTATIMAWTAFASAALLLPLAWVSESSLLGVSAPGWAILLALAVFSHAGGQSLIAYALAHLSATFSSVGLLLQPVIAAFLAWLLLHERMHLWQAVGGVVVLAAIALARRGSHPATRDVRDRPG